MSERVVEDLLLVESNPDQTGLEENRFFFQRNRQKWPSLYTGSFDFRGSVFHRAEDLNDRF